MLQRFLVPIVIAALCLGNVTAGLIGASGIRADERRAEAKARERKAVETYRASVAKVAITVFDAVQPLNDADNAFANPSLGLYIARNDVLARSGAVASLVKARARLVALTPPAPQTSSHKKLVAGLDTLTGAARGLEKATKAASDRAGFVAAFQTAYLALSDAESDWLTALRAGYGVRPGGPLPVPAPVASRAWDKGRKTPTKGGFILRSDLACFGIAEAMDAHPIDTGELYLKNAPTMAKVLRRTTTKLRALPPPPADVAFVRRLRVQLTAADSFPAAIEGTVAAVKRGDPAAAQAQYRRLLTALKTFQEVSRAFRSYGAHFCADMFDVDDLLAPKRGSGGSTLGA
jgi:hypothetical protein